MQCGTQVLSTVTNKAKAVVTVKVNGIYHLISSNTSLLILNSAE